MQEEVAEVLDNRLGNLVGAIRSRQALTHAVSMLSWITMAAVGVAIVSVCLAFWALLRTPEPVYFATRTDGALVAIIPLDQPHISDNQVLNFATDVITGALTLDFANYRQELATRRDQFTEAGFNAFVNALESSGNLDLLRNRRMASTAVANSAFIIDKGRSGNGYLWRVEVQVAVTYESSSERQHQQLVGLLDVVRIPTWQNEWGVAVSRFLARTTR